MFLSKFLDDAFASYLSIPTGKVPHFKYKMALWENQLRTKRRASKSMSKIQTTKREISAQDRFKKVNRFNI
jgi:hypothetical protein